MTFAAIVAAMIVSAQQPSPAGPPSVTGAAPPDIAAAVAAATVTVGEGDIVLPLQGVGEGPEQHCFLNPVADSVMLAGRKVSGIRLNIEVRAAGYHAIHAAFLAIDPHAVRACMPLTADIGGQQVGLSPASTSNMARRSGSSEFTRVAAGFLTDRNRWGGRGNENITFEQLLDRVGVRRSAGLLGVLFGRSDDQFVGIRINSTPSGAILTIGKSPTRIATNNEVWLAGTKLESARLEIGRRAVELRTCAIRALPGRVTAEFDCRLPIGMKPARRLEPRGRPSPAASHNQPR